MNKNTTKVNSRGKTREWDYVTDNKADSIDGSNKCDEKDFVEISENFEKKKVIKRDFGELCYLKICSDDQRNLNS